MFLSAFLMVFVLQSAKTSADFLPILQAGGPRVRWCAKSSAEYDKCVEIKFALKNAFIDNLTQLPPIINCIPRFSQFGCIEAVENNEADVASFDAGLLYHASRWHAIKPVSVEEHNGEVSRHSVVVVRNDAGVSSLGDLRNKQLCTPGMVHMAGWLIPMRHLISRSSELEDNQETGIQMPIKECTSWVSSASKFFGPSCVPGAFNRRLTDPADNPFILCKKCKLFESSGRLCAEDDPFAGNDGVLNCMTQHVGDVAFLDQELALRLASIRPSGVFSLLCLDGSLRPLTTDPTSFCPWGKFPANAFITAADRSKEETAFLQRYIHSALLETKKLVPLIDPATGQRRFNGSDLLWSDSTTSLRHLPFEEQTASAYLGLDLMNFLSGRQLCPVRRMRLCVVGYKELDKCTVIQLELLSRGILPELGCVMGINHWHCMRMVMENDADVLVVDASDAVLGEELYGLIPFMSEVHESAEASSYSVAVVKKKNKSTSLLDLRNIRTCHGSIYSSIGWTLPISFLLNQNRVRKAADCDDLVYQVSQIFQKACAPGASQQSGRSHSFVLQPETLCDLCIGDIESHCIRSPDEPYYGHHGAFKCLAEGGGQVAFVDHLTVGQNTDGRNKRLWARALVSNDFELLCKDGTRAPVTDYLRCNLGKAPNNLVMTSRNTPEAHITLYIRLLKHVESVLTRSTASQWALTMTSNSFSHSEQNLIFSDSLTRLIAIDKSNRSVNTLIEQTFLDSVKRTQCSSSGSLFGYSVVFLFVFRVGLFDIW